MRKTNTISSTVRKETYTLAELIRAIKHNYRLTKQSSVIENDKAFIRTKNGEWKNEKAKELQADKNRFLKYVAAEHARVLKHCKDIIEDENNFDNPAGKSGKMKRWGALKHNLVSEAVVHLGKGFDKNIQNEKALELIHSNFKSWVEAHGMFGLAFEPVIHMDEAGQNHIHFLFFSSDKKSGRKFDYRRKAILKDLQDRIANGMEEFGLRRGNDWDENPATKKRHETIKEFQNRMDKEKEQDLRIKKAEEKAEAAMARSEKIEAESNAKIAEVEADVQYAQERLDEAHLQIEKEKELIEQAQRFIKKPVEELLALGEAHRRKTTKSRMVTSYNKETYEEIKTEVWESWISESEWNNFVKELPEPYFPYLPYLAHADSPRIVNAKVAKKYEIPAPVITTTTTTDTTRDM